MTACDLFKTISTDLGSEIIGFIQKNHKDVFRATLATLAPQRKLRPVFVERKPPAEQLRWVLDTLRFRTSEAVGEQLLQVWLMKAQSPMLVDFMDALGLEHDGNGAVEDLPGSLDPEKTKSAVAKLLEKYDAPKVAIYLHVFQLQQAGGWAPLADVLTSEPKLRLGA